jgi:putative transposase
LGSRGGRVSSKDRASCLELVQEAQASGARKEKACEILGVSLRTLERWEKIPEDGRKGPNTRPSNSLSEIEVRKILEVANSSEYADLSPWQIVPKLADKGEYIASESSFYRILKRENLLNYRQRSRPKKYQQPKELVATGPNQIWSWDISYLKAAIKGTYYYLYLPMDVFSRMIIHWEVYERESSEHAAEMIEKACRIQGIGMNQVVLHSDNGGPMKGATMLATLQRLGVAPSFSRPRVSDDNPFSESLFKTLKYCPSFPDRGFKSIKDAKSWVEKFVHWYNHVHLHSGINWVTPYSRHFGFDQKILDQRHAIYQLAREKKPNRWSDRTRDWSRPAVVELNPGRNSKANRIEEYRKIS